MPELIESIEKIARDKQRDVLILLFHDKAEDEAITPFFDYGACKTRQQIIEWLTANHISFTPCSMFGSVDCTTPYLGEIYIDVLNDWDDPTYTKVREFLEYPDGTMKIEGVRFCHLELYIAML